MAYVPFVWPLPHPSTRRIVVSPFRFAAVPGPRTECASCNGWIRKGDERWVPVEIESKTPHLWYNSHIPRMWDHVHLKCMDAYKSFHALAALS